MPDDKTPPPSNETTLPCDFCGNPLPEETTTSYCDEECLHLDTHSYGNPS